MRIPISHLSRETVETAVRAYPGVRPAAGTSPGYEIPITGKHKGRIHIMFASDGLEVHRDVVSKGNKHRVIKLDTSTRGKKAYQELKEIIQSLS